MTMTEVQKDYSYLKEWMNLNLYSLDWKNMKKGHYWVTEISRNCRPTIWHVVRYLVKDNVNYSKNKWKNKGKYFLGLWNV